MSEQGETGFGAKTFARCLKAAPLTESTNFDLHESKQYVQYIAHLKNNYYYTLASFRWFLLFSIGVCTALVATCINISLKYLFLWRFELQARLVANGSSLGLQWFAFTGVCVALGSVAAFLVCYVEPSAAGSGISEIKSHLNGVRQPRVLRLRTLACKAGGIICSVAAGLPCGKEGPMIHCGAIIGTQHSEGSFGPLARPFRSGSEARDFAAAGAAAGVSAAFSAPIGGVLFAIEEGASHMNPRIMGRVFVCAAVTTMVIRVMMGGLDYGWGVLGTSVPLEFGRFHGDRHYHVWELVLFGAMGVCGGLCGAFFVWLNVKLTHWRSRHIGPTGRMRFTEALILTAFFATFDFLAPIIALGGNGVMDTFLPTQQLFWVRPDSAVRLLLHNEDHFHQGLLCFFGVTHFFKTCLLYGLGVPSGMFLPSLITGASLGRSFGQVMAAKDYVTAGADAYALIGAASMMSGVARITISLAVIIMESSGESQWCLPIFIAVIFAKVTGDFFNQGIFDTHIGIKNVPLLETYPDEHKMLNIQAQDIMALEVVTLESITTVGEVLDVLAGCGHCGFPVLDHCHRHFAGLAERSTLHHILWACKDYKGSLLEEGEEAPAEAVPRVPYSAMAPRLPEFPSLEELQLRLAPEDYVKRIDLRPYMNTGLYTVLKHTVVARCYMLFRNMGLRHLPVLDCDGNICGIITRKDLILPHGHGDKDSDDADISKGVNEVSSSPDVEEQQSSHPCPAGVPEAAAPPTLLTSRSAVEQQAKEVRSAVLESAV
mmetsp:Transcript_26213/g.57227  ORF Transcript_26213/g.57227 Transcript_26213/m.57227 type:complete len:770 (+) Transcript_26213:64-2373(+)